MEHNETFIVICIENKWFEKQFTIGERYKASLYNNEFYILHDIFHKGNQVAFNKKDFITLREYRKNKINNILKKLWKK